MNNKLLEIQYNIDKIIRNSAIPVCKQSEQEVQEMFQKLLIQYEENQNTLKSVN